MDIGAYLNMDDLSKIVEENGIAIPRERGYRLMSEEVKCNIEKRLRFEDIVYECVKSSIHKCQILKNFSLNCSYWAFSLRTRFFEKRYLDKSSRTVRWEVIKRDGRLNRKRRKAIKISARNAYNKRRYQFERFNHYVGRSDVLMAHARIGGDNWVEYGGKDLVHEPWFIERVDDGWDSTYCDIYCRIKGGKK